MAITVNVLTSGTDTSAGTSATTASISPGANKLILAFVVTGDTSGANVEAGTSGEPGGEGLGGMSQWSRFANQQQGSGNQRVDVLNAMDASPGSGTLTFSYGGTTVENVAWVVVEVGGVVTTGINGGGAIVQVIDTTDSGSNVQATLPGSVTAGNATFGIATGNTQSPTWSAGSGFVQLGSGWSMSSPSNKGIVQWDVDGNNPIIFSNDGTPLCALCAFEIQADPLQTLVANLLTNTATVHTANLSIPATAALSTVARAAAVPAPTLSTGTRPTPATVAALRSVPVPGFAMTEVGVTVAGVASVPVPVLSAGAKPTPATVAVLRSVPAPSFSTGMTVASATVARAATVNTPVIRTGPSPAVVARSATVSSVAIRTGPTGTTVARSAAVSLPAIATGSRPVPVTVARSAAVPAPSLRMVELAVTVAGVAGVPAPVIVFTVGANLLTNSPTVFAPSSIKQTITANLTAASTTVHDPGQIKQTVIAGLVTNTPTVPIVFAVGRAVTANFMTATVVVHNPSSIRQTVTASLLTSTPTVHAAGVRADVRPNLLTNTPTVFAPASVKQALGANLLTSTAVVHNPTQITRRVTTNLVGPTTTVYNPALDSNVNAFVIASTTTVFVPEQLQRGFSPVGIASSEVFGLATVLPSLATVGIPSAEAFGVAVVAGAVTVPGISSDEAFGVALLSLSRIEATFFTSTPTVHSPSIPAAFQVTGIASEEAFGTAQVMPRADWWSSRYAYRRVATITAPATEALPAGHPVEIMVPVAVTVTQGKMRLDMADAEVVRPVDSVVSPWRWFGRTAVVSGTDVVVRFLLDEDLPAGASAVYYLHYGDPIADGSGRPTFIDNPWPVQVSRESAAIAYTRPEEHWRDGVGQVRGAQATLEFIGVEVRVLADVGPRAGIAEVQLDTEAWTTVDLFSPLAQEAIEVLVRQDLTPDVHRIRFRMTGNRNESALGENVTLARFEYVKPVTISGLEEELDELVLDAATTV